MITPTADGARGTCYLVVFNVNTRGLMVTGRYQDTLKKDLKGWRFSSSHLTIETPTTGESGKMLFLTGQ